MVPSSELQISIEVRKGWIEEHLRYEIGMLNQTHRLLYWTAPALPQGVILNALIESFCVHARTLIEVFRKETEATQSRNGKKQWLALTSGFVQQELYKDFDRLLNNQISHLGDLRETDPVKKIDRKLRVTLVDLLRRDLFLFKQHLKPEWSSPPLPDIDDFAISPPAYLAISPLPPSACSISFGTTVEISDQPTATTTTADIGIYIFTNGNPQ
jgi:hypothetical protein